MTTATRADLLAPFVPTYGFDRLPVTGRTVRFRSLSELEYQEFEMARIERDDVGRLVTREEAMRTTRARLAVCCLCDDAGERLMSPADVDPLSESMDLADSLFLFGRLQEHCGLSGDLTTLADRREAAKKNCVTAPVNGSP